MSKQTLAVIVGAIVLFAIAVVGALAFTGGDSSSDNGHKMQGGSTMTGQMSTTDGMMDDTDMTP